VQAVRAAAPHIQIGNARNTTARPARAHLAILRRERLVGGGQGAVFLHLLRAALQVDAQLRQVAIARRNILWPRGAVSGTHSRPSDTDRYPWRG
jgi:hypothetical protein